MRVKAVPGVQFTKKNLPPMSMACWWHLVRLWWPEEVDDGGMVRDVRRAREQKPGLRGGRLHASLEPLERRALGGKRLGNVQLVAVLALCKRRRTKRDSCAPSSRS